MDHIFTCLHCQEPFVIAHNDFNCRILRHGVYKHTLQPIDPHASKEVCDKLINDGLIYGCGKPLLIVASANANANASARAYEIVICNYI